MAKPNNVIDIKIARALKEVGLKPTAEIIAEVLDRIEGRPDKVPKEKKTIFFKDCPLVTQALGCKTASAIFRRLEYRFYTMPNGFYKFLAPCKNTYYRKGDSLAEEMPLMNVRTIQRAFKKIVTAYKSKTLYEAAKKELGAIGAFRGMPFLSYFDNNTHQTFYVRNKEIADLIVKGNNPFKRKIFKDIKLPSYGAVFQQLKVKNVICRTRQNVICAHDKMSYAEASEPAVYKASQPLHRIHTYNTSLSISLSEEKLSCEEREPTEFREREIKKVILEEQPKLETDNASQMMKIWTETTDREKEKLQSRETMVNLERAFETRFNSSIQEWEKFCKLITSSKWLMGEIISQKTGKGFNINLAWVSKEENIDKIMGGEYTMGDRSNTVNIPLRELRHEDPQVLAFMRKALQRMGEGYYIGYMQTAKIDKNVRGEIEIRFPYAWTAQHVAQNDRLGLGTFIGSVGVPAVLICKPDGGVVGRIEARNVPLMNLR